MDHTQTSHQVWFAMADQDHMVQEMQELGMS